MVGLGNPTSEYQKSYHNVGQMALDYILGQNDLNAPSFKEQKTFTYLQTENLIFVKPRTFMNESGKSVQGAMLYFSKRKPIKPENLLIIHDDSDLALGTFKITFGQRSAGHGGVESVIKTLNTKDFWRCRIGIRTEPGKAGTFVLRSISLPARKKLQFVFEEITRKLMENEKAS